MKRILACAILIAVMAYGAPLLKGQQASPQSTSPITTVPGSVSPVATGAPSQTAVAVTTVPSPASPSHVPEQIEWALAMSMLMRFVMKKGWISFLTPTASGRIKAVCGFLLATTTAAGIHFVVSGSLLDGNGASITITGLSMDAFKDIGFQWVSQQTWYEALVKKGGAA